VLLNLPAGHCAHRESDASPKPGLHTHAFSDVDPSSTVVSLAEHGTHTAESTLLHVPLAHGAHGPPSGPVSPAAQSLHTEAPGVEYTPTPHCAQVSAADAPEMVEYLPAAHAVHTLALPAPVWLENVPARHGTHDALVAAPITEE
jgi:hypothetical protein